MYKNIEACKDKVNTLEFIVNGKGELSDTDHILKPQNQLNSGKHLT